MFCLCVGSEKWEGYALDHLWPPVRMGNSHPSVLQQHGFTLVREERGASLVRSQEGNEYLVRQINGNTEVRSHGYFPWSSHVSCVGHDFILATNCGCARIVYFSSSSFLVSNSNLFCLELCCESLKDLHWHLIIVHDWNVLSFRMFL